MEAAKLDWENTRTSATLFQVAIKATPVLIVKGEFLNITRTKKNEKSEKKIYQQQQQQKISNKQTNIIINEINLSQRQWWEIVKMII